MKTVPTVRLADASETAGLPEWPEEIQLAMTDIAGVAREGLLAVSVAAGMAKQDRGRCPAGRSRRPRPALRRRAAGGARRRAATCQQREPNQLSNDRQTKTAVLMVTR